VDSGPAVTAQPAATTATTEKESADGAVSSKCPVEVECGVLNGESTSLDVDRAACAQSSSSAAATIAAFCDESLDINISDGEISAYRNGEGTRVLCSAPLQSGPIALNGDHGPDSRSRRGPQGIFDVIYYFKESEGTLDGQNDPVVPIAREAICSHEVGSSVGVIRGNRDVVVEIGRVDCLLQGASPNAIHLIYKRRNKNEPLGRSGFCSAESREEGEKQSEWSNEREAGPPAGAEEGLQRISSWAQHAAAGDWTHSWASEIDLAN
jgi:hypothetical protein